LTQDKRTGRGTRLDGHLWADPAIIEAGNTAVGVLARLLSYLGPRAGRLVPAEVAASIEGQDRGAVASLARVGLVELRPDGGVTLGRERGILYCETPWDRRRRLLERAQGHATAAQIAARVAFYGGLCWICRTAPYTAIDHVKPLAVGGSNWPANLRPACTSCNARKGAQWPFGRTM